MPRRLLCLAALSACTLPPSPLGELPGDEAGSAGTTEAPPGTTGEPPTTGTAEPGTGDTTAPTTAVDDMPMSAWDLYCAHIVEHGGECDPQVDEWPDLQYPGRGFVVHEWGTDTAVVGSDGQTLRGLRPDEGDLPGFVYDRLGAGALAGGTSAHVMMETPVTYFYSEVERAAKVHVRFPAGVFSQWYPAVVGFAPKIAAPGAIPKLLEYADPVLDIDFMFVGDACRQQYGAISDGLLDWGEVTVLARGVDEPLPDAPLADYAWGHAREVDANLVRVAGRPGVAEAQRERFLFYRGPGNFPLPLTLTSEPGGAVLAANPGALAVPRLFLVHVDAERGAFHEHAGGVSPGQALFDVVPSLAPAPSHALFTAALGERVVEALDAAGLYHDEAVAMVATWRRQWFLTPGVRALYLVPQAWTDASIPLAVEPAPQSTVRVMMIRSELLTPEQEQLDLAAAQGLAAPDTEAAARDHFLALGRFAEPRLRRAAALLGDPPYVAGFLAEIDGADTRVVAGE
jgi:hypothetical protein